MSDDWNDPGPYTQLRVAAMQSGDITIAFRHTSGVANADAMLAVCEFADTIQRLRAEDGIPGRVAVTLHGAVPTEPLTRWEWLRLAVIEFGVLLRAGDRDAWTAVLCGYMLACIIGYWATR